MEIYHQQNFQSTQSQTISMLTPQIPRQEFLQGTCPVFGLYQVLLTHREMITLFLQE
jgi:hypothetical protein